MTAPKLDLAALKALVEAEPEPYSLSEETLTALIEAAEEAERLRQALEQIRDDDYAYGGKYREIARAALERK